MDGTKDNKSIQSFENKSIRMEWDAEKEEWYFSVADVVAALTDSTDPKQYIKKMRARDKELNARWGTICTLTVMTATDGKRYRTTAATIQGILRIIQSIPSPKKAEPLKLWLAQVGSERIAETIDPEQTIDRVLETYLKKGYAREWINQRLQAIQVRKELTDEWQDRGVQKLKNFPFQAHGFAETLKRFDYARHFAGSSEIAGIVLADIQKTGELAGKVFDESQRDSVYGLFFKAASLDCLMREMEKGLADVRRAFASLNKIRPESLSALDDDNAE